ncbi:hypothetical protein F4604DRAFT_1929011 [Suillus subluteus]|nr:hypothetical protein F4604DRAFT_1929011 [Suillus subluteus]
MSYYTLTAPAFRTLKMNLAASTTTSCDEVMIQRSTPSSLHLQNPCLRAPPSSSCWSYDMWDSPPSSPPSFSSAHQSSPPSSPPCSPGSTTASDPDEESDVFPFTPNCKRSSGARHTANISTGIHFLDTHDSNHYHPYHWPPLFEERHFFEKFSRNITGEGPPQAPSWKVTEVYLQHIEGMSPHTFHCAIHYKEAVCETLHMDYYSELWQHEAA